MTPQQHLEWKEILQNSDALFYGELEYYLDEYLPKFFSVEVKDVGFDQKHQMNDLQFWFTVSWLHQMGCLEYGTSPRGAWLTEKGKELKEYVLKTENPITKILYSHEQ